MRLKSIKLAGFKSFVDPTTVSFSSNLSAVVGPNGCGKSNIIDAVRWVMGESSAKNLRGESTTDVIFNGSTSRQPVGQASIELLFDNSDHTLSGEYTGYNEVSIKRKVTREGQSTYFLNNQKCRRRDVTDLFLGTGLGPRSYSIIEQGMISRLIESRPEELRVYIEEAAGISRYKERRRETANRISRTRENLERLDDLCDELGRQLASLKRQAAAAKNYTELKEEERACKSQLAAVQWRDLRQKLLDQRIGMGRIQDEIALLRSEQDTRFAQLDVQKESLAEQQQAFGISQGDFYKLGADIARLEQTIEYQKQQTQQWQTDFDEAQKQLQYTEEVIANDSRELHHLQQQQDQLNPDIELADQQLLEADALLKSSEEKQQKWQASADEQAKMQSEIQRQLDITKTKLQHNNQRFEQLAKALQSLREEKSALTNNTPEHSLVDLQSQTTIAEQTWQQAKNDISQWEDELAQLRQTESKDQQAVEELRHSISQISGQHISLEVLIDEAQKQFPQCPETWLQDGKTSLLKQLSIESGWEAAIEHVLGDWLQAAYIQHQFLHQEQDLEGVPGLSVLIEHDLDTVALPNSLLDKVQGDMPIAGWLGQVVTAKSIKEAQALLTDLPTYASVILPSGIWLGHGWLRTSRLAKKDGTNGLIERQQQLTVLQSQLEKLQAEYEQYKTLQQKQREIIESKQQELTAKRSGLEKAQQTYQQYTSTLALFEQQKAQEQQQLGRLDKQLTEQKVAHQELAKTIDELSEEKEAWEVDLSASLLSRDQLEEQKKPLMEQLHEDREQHSAIQQKVIQLQARVSSVEAQKNSLTRSIERLQEQNAQWQVKKQEVQIRSQEQGDDEDQLPKLQIQLEELVVERLAAEQTMSTQRTSMSEVETDIKELEQQQLRQEQVIQQKEQLLQEQKLIEREVQVLSDNIKQQTSNDNIVIEKLADSLPDTTSEQSLSQALQKIQERITRLGAINLMAINEYDEQNTRKVLLDEQRAELVEALDSLEEAIRKIDRETRQRFKDTFERVNSSLKELFPKVFGGGRASLELTDGDLLSTGVSIMAQPPGKRNSSIHLLSGGEKALTAIALVFSIFELNPSPFCMLDEVDAPLDDANVERYARLVKEMSARVQFIFISHNKIAMEMAHQLMGVTMQESGVSRLVTVDIDEAVSMTQSTTH